MSLVGTYVRATDGQLYLDPVIYGAGWFVCFDDDDPVELVVFGDTKRPELDWLKVTRGRGSCGLRCVPPDWDRMTQAKAFWCELVGRIPIPQSHHGIVERAQIMQGVIYDPEVIEERKTDDGEAQEG